MDFFSALKDLKFVFSVYRLSSVFVDKTKKIIEQVGLSELKSAETTLSDAMYSNNPTREIESAITQLRLCFEKLGDDNIKKVEVLLLMCNLYYYLGQQDICVKYQEKAISTFDRWLNILDKCVLRIPEKEYLLSSISYYDIERDLGIEWRGAKSESLASKFVSVFVGRSYSDRFRDGIIYARSMFKEKVNKMFI